MSKEFNTLPVKAFIPVATKFVSYGTVFVFNKRHYKVISVYDNVFYAVLLHPKRDDLVWDANGKPFMINGHQKQKKSHSFYKDYWEKNLKVKNGLNYLAKSKTNDYGQNR